MEFSDDDYSYANENHTPHRVNKDDDGKEGCYIYDDSTNGFTIYKCIERDEHSDDDCYITAVESKESLNEKQEKDLDQASYEKNKCSLSRGLKQKKEKAVDQGSSGRNNYRLQQRRARKARLTTGLIRSLKQKQEKDVDRNSNDEIICRLQQLPDWIAEAISGLMRRRSSTSLSPAFLTKATFFRPYSSVLTLNDQELKLFFDEMMEAISNPIRSGSRKVMNVGQCYMRPCQVWEIFANEYFKHFKRIPEFKVIHVESTGGSGDKGVDIKLTIQENIANSTSIPKHEEAVVQVKRGQHLRSGKGNAIVNQLIGACVSFGVNTGILFTDEPSHAIRKQAFEIVSKAAMRQISIHFITSDTIKESARLDIEACRRFCNTFFSKLGISLSIQRSGYAESHEPNFEGSWFRLFVIFVVVVVVVYSGFFVYSLVVQGF